MKALVFGATGATGKQLVKQLLERGIEVRLVARAGTPVPKESSDNPHVEVHRGDISSLTPSEIESLLDGCEAFVSCLGHNMNFKGIFGHPRYLVFDALKRVCQCLQKRGTPRSKVILMSTVGYTNKTIGERNSWGEIPVHFLLSLFLPPYWDNMRSAHYLIQEIGCDDKTVQWVSVRPDSLIDEECVSAYEATPTIERSPIFDAGKTSRINVAHFMAELLTKETLWEKWKGKTPVLYNR